MDMTRYGEASPDMMEMTRCPSAFSDNSVATPRAFANNKTMIFNKTGTDLMDETCASGLLGSNSALNESEAEGKSKMSTTDFLRALSKDDDESLSEDPVHPPNSGFLQTLVGLIFETKSAFLSSYDCLCR